MDITTTETGLAEKSGGQLIAECLVAHGVDTAFMVPGESFLNVIDALRDVQDEIRVVIGRHEAGTANMAEAYGKLTGKPGICFVTRGPGSSQASVAVHTAFQDATPLILFVGQVAREQLGREAFQEIDYHHMFAKTAKWVTEIVDPRRVPELVSRAFHVAVNGRPGPVVISIPEDMQSERCVVAMSNPYRHATAAPTAADVSTMQDLLAAAERPVLILGGGGWSAEATAQMRRFSERFQIPVIAGFRRQDLFDNTHPNYAGFLGFGVSPHVVEMVKKADLMLVVGERLGDTTTTGYTLIDFPRPKQKLIHVHAGPEELGILYEGDLLIAATTRDFARSLDGLVPLGHPDRSAWISGGHDGYLKFSSAPPESPQKINVPSIVNGLAEHLPADAIITNGAGTYTGFVHRYYRYRDYGSQLAPTSGSMGYGLPAALAAKIVHPDRPVVCFAGDGDFMMAFPELATANMYGLGIIVIVIDNASYGSIRVHQERHFPGRVYGTDLVNPDFIALAKACGCHAEEVGETADFTAAFEKAVASGKPSVLTIRLDINRVVAFNPRTS